MENIIATVRILEVAFVVSWGHKTIAVSSVVTMLFAVCIVSTRSVHDVYVTLVQAVEVWELEVAATL